MHNRKLVILSIISLIFSLSAQNKEDNIVDISMNIILRGVEFDQENYNITNNSKTILFEVYRSLNKYQNRKIKIIGYFEKKYCKKIKDINKTTEIMADNIRKYLIELGIKEDRIIIEGGGCAHENTNISKKYISRIEIKPL